MTITITKTHIIAVVAASVVIAVSVGAALYVQAADSRAALAAAEKEKAEAGLQSLRATVERRNFCAELCKDRCRGEQTWNDCACYVQCVENGDRCMSLCAGWGESLAVDSLCVDECRAGLPIRNFWYSER